MGCLCRWNGAELDYNQDDARQTVVNWIDGTAGTSSAFDFPTKGILQEAVKNCEYWRLRDQNGKPPGVIGYYPKRAVTFIDNHDTGLPPQFTSTPAVSGSPFIFSHEPYSELPASSALMYIAWVHYEHREVADEHVYASPLLESLACMAPAAIFPPLDKHALWLWCLSTLTIQPT